MRRSLHLAALALAGAALAPACFLNTGPLETDGAGAATSTGGSGGTGGTGGTGGMMAVCGDGKLGGTEQCDDGDLDPLDGCGPTCVIEPGWACDSEPSVCNKTCGDGVLDPGEACDDGNIKTGDGCNQGCKVEPGWECDASAPSVCTISCGDGTLDGGESCDDGNLLPGDGCDGLCKIEQGWMCPGGDPTQPSVCSTVCGDGIVAGAEACDDADMDGTNGCNIDCTAVNPGWTCNPPGGAASCDTTCGDGIPAGAEECDDFNQDSYDGCGALCKLEKTCGNGIVDPGEPCDGGAGCTMCTLDAGTACANATPILPDPAGLDPVTGVRVSYIEGNSNGVTPVATNLLPACSFNFTNAMLHTYTTGKTPSLVTVKSLNKLADGTNTYTKNVLVAYRDCPNKQDLEGCDNSGNHASVTTGFLPAQTTLYIVLGGDGGPDKGLYRLEVTEQPVKLFFHEDFGAETMLGVYPPPLDLTVNVAMPGASWVTCVLGTVTLPCTSVNLNSHSGGAFGVGHVSVMDGMTSTVALVTPTRDLSGLQVARAQYTFQFNDGAGSDSGSVVPLDDVTPIDAAIKKYTTTTADRTFVNLPLVPKSSVAFVFDDGGNNNAGKLSIDDIYVYGY